MSNRRLCRLARFGTDSTSMPSGRSTRNSSDIGCHTFFRCSNTWFEITTSIEPVGQGNASFSRSSIATSMPCPRAAVAGSG